MRDAYQEAVLDDAARDLMAQARRVEFLVGVPALLCATSIGAGAFAWLFGHGYFDGVDFKAAGVVLFVLVAAPMAVMVPIARRLSRVFARARRGEWVTEIARVQRVSREDLDERTRTWF